MMGALHDSETLLDEAARWHEEARLLEASGKLAAAGEKLNRALAVFEKLCGSNHPDVANVLNAKGVLAQRQHDVPQARRCFRRAWQITRSHLRKSMDDDLPTGEQIMEVDNLTRIGVQVLVNLGNLERETGNWTLAGRVLKRAVRVAQTQLGRDDLDLCYALNSLGMWCKFTGRFELGRKCYRRAMSILRRHHGPRASRSSPEVAVIYHNMGGLEHAAGDFAAGEPLARKSVDIRQRAVGTTHPDYAADIGGLAAIVADQGRSDEAEGLYREALAIFERCYGDDHYEIAVILHNLGAVEVARERFDSAWGLYHRSAAMKQRWLGEDHPDLALTLHNLAVLAIELNRTAQAKTYCRQALTIFECNLVETHPTLVACRECWAALESDVVSQDPV